MALTDLFDEPQHAHGPDAQHCSAFEYPAQWAELSLGWSRVLAAARTIQSRHVSDSQDPVLSMCADAARETSISELRWVWARLVNKFIDEAEQDA